MLPALAAIIAALLGLHIGATWPWLAFWVRHPTKGTRVSRTKEERRLIVVTWLMVGVAVFGALVGILLIGQRATASRDRQAFRDYIACQSGYNNDFRAAYQARADASIKTTRALDRVITAVSAQDGDEFRAAVKHYLKVRQQQTEDRAANPLPPLPDKVCGQPPRES